MRALGTIPALTLGLAMLAGCGGDVVTAVEVEIPYDGPLVAEGRSGAAGDIVECGTWGSGGYAGEGVYGEGATADSPDRALDVARSERLFGGVQEGLAVAKVEDDRVLYVLEVDGVVKQAVIVHDGPATEGAGGDGWYVESWAACDYSELPRDFTDSIGLQVWDGADGEAAPTTEIEGWTGPEHCGWQSMTFLYLGDDTFVRDPQPDLADHLAAPYDPHDALPTDAVDTGFSREGDRLWIAADGDTAYVGTRADVEAWPRDVKGLGCE
jgi:hypothetical protein